MCQPDYPEVGPQLQPVPDQLPAYKDSMLLDNNSKQKMLDLLIYYKALVGLCKYDRYKLDIFARESMLDW